MSSINYKALVTVADFKAAANSIYKRNMSAKKDMQSALVCALKHMDQHGDYTGMKLLIDVGASFGKNLNVALQEWVLKYSWLALDGKAWAKDKDKSMDVEGGTAKEWWTMERDAKAKPFDFQKSLTTLFEAIGKELARSETTLTKEAVFTEFEVKLREIVPVTDQIAALFDRLPEGDRSGMLQNLMLTLPQTEVQSQAEELPQLQEAV
jgi:hypothetical protein